MLPRLRDDESGPLTDLWLMLEAAGLPSYNSYRAWRLSANKLTSHALFAAAGIPQPETYRAEEPAWREREGEWMVKEVFGRGGVGSYYCPDMASAERCLEENPDKMMLVQRYLADNRCWRVLCSPEKSLDGGEKISEQRVVSVGLGARCQYGEVEEEMAALARRMLRAVGGDGGGADILEVDDQLYGLEINTNFGYDWENPLLLERILDEIEARAGRH